MAASNISAATTAAARGVRAILQSEQVGKLQLWNQFQRIGGNLTPASVSAVLMEADSGRIARFVDLMHEAREKDGHLHSLLETRELSIAGLAWQVDEPEEASTSESDKAVLCQEALNDCWGFDRAVAHHIGETNLFGFANSEIIWDRKGSNLVPIKIIPISCRRFGFTSAAGELRFDPKGNQSINEDGVDLATAYPAGKFLMSSRRINGDVPAREGLAWLLLWCALYRNWGLKDWLSLAEMAWKPWRRGVYHKGSSPEDIEILRHALLNFVATGAALLPETVDFNIEGPKGAAGPINASSHRELVEYLGREMSKAVLGQTDLIEPGENGARSATELRATLRNERRQADAHSLAREIQHDIINPFYRVNWGERPRLRPGKFSFTTDESPDLEKFAKGIQALVAAGTHIPARYIRDQTGIPEPKEGEEVLAPGVTPAPVTPGPAKPAPAEPAKPKEPEEAPPAPKEPAPSKTAPAAPKEPPARK